MTMIDNLPYNDTAEKTVLGAAIQGGDVNTLVTDVGLKAVDFYIEPNRIVYLAIMQLYDQNKAIDIVTVDGQLHGNPAYGGIGFLKELAQSVPTTRHMVHYAKIVKEMSQRRYYIALGNEMQQIAADCNKDINLVNDAIEKSMVAENSEIEIDTFDNVYLTAYNDIVRAYEKKGEIPFQKTGFPSLDAAIGGLDGLTVIGARPSMGKTMLGVNIAEYVTFREDKPALIFSLEMTKEQIAVRIIASQTGTKHADCKFGTLGDDDFDAIGKLDINPGKKMTICDESIMDISKIKSISRRCKKNFGDLGVIIVDYIQLMDTGGDERYGNRAADLGKVSRGLKLLSKELKCPIVALSQLSRRVEDRQEKRPQLSDLRDSGAIEQDADTILFIYRDEYYHKDSRKRGVAEVIIAKARNGETGTVELAFQPQIMRFMEKSELERIRKERSSSAHGAKNENPA